MKLILIVALIVLCGYIGFGLSRYYVNRRKFFEELVMLMEKLSLDINFTKDKLTDILLSQKINSKSLSLLVNNFIAILDGPELNFEALFDGIKFLSEDEKGIILSFFKSLGRFDVELQTLQIFQYRERLQDILKVCEEKERKYSPMFIKLALMFGAVIGLIFI